jgi:hypothetical protein
VEMDVVLAGRIATRSGAQNRATPRLPSARPAAVRALAAGRATPQRADQGHRHPQFILGGYLDGSIDDRIVHRVEPGPQLREVAIDPKFTGA